MSKVNLTIDGKSIQASQGDMIIQAADGAGIYIPRFCYHRKLSVAANCRMCLVEVEKAPKTLPACATPVSEGMRVFTRSKSALESQRAVMEFLLINHPLDCPICDQGGQCELQDLALGFGQDESRYTEGKRSVEDKDIGPLVATEMTRCIHCTRCVRFGEEIAGFRELGMTGRGGSSEIGTYVEKAMASELSGNIIDLCPVGALTAKPSRFRGRAWEYRQHESVAPHDCVGSNIYIHTRLQNDTPYRQLMRVVPKDNDAVNETWISDRDRFSYEAVSAEQRLTTPMIKVEGAWRNVDWETAIAFARDRLNTIQKRFGGEQIAGLVHPSSTLEEQYLMQKLIRGLGSGHIDHRLHQSDFTDQDAQGLYPNLGGSLVELGQVDAALLLGSNLREAQPMACHRLRQAQMHRAAKIMAMNTMHVDYHIPLAQEVVSPINELVHDVACLAKAAASKFSGDLPLPAQSLPKNLQPDESHLAIIEALLAAESSHLIVGEMVTTHPHASVITGYVEILAQLTGSRLGVMSMGANASGAWLAGAVPHRGPIGMKTHLMGDHAAALFETARRGYVLFNVEPNLDCFNPNLAVTALKNSEGVIAFSSFMSETLSRCADVLFPLASMGETAGTFVNVEGRWQSFSGVTEPLGSARPGWKILRVLGNFLDIPGFDQSSAEAVRQEVYALYDTHHQDFRPAERVLSHLLPESSPKLMRMGGWSALHVDALLRHAPALQATGLGHTLIKMNSTTAGTYQLLADRRVVINQSGIEVTLPWAIDDTIPDGQIYLPAGLLDVAFLGPVVGKIEIIGSEPRHG